MLFNFNLDNMYIYAIAIFWAIYHVAIGLLAQLLRHIHYTRLHGISNSDRRVRSLEFLQKTHVVQSNTLLP